MFGEISAISANKRIEAIAERSFVPNFETSLFPSYIVIAITLRPFDTQKWVENAFLG